jgi:hypothetical protein
VEGTVTVKIWALMLLWLSQIGLKEALFKIVSKEKG